MILLDTHVLVWLDAGSPQLGEAARSLIDGALAEHGVFVSAISFWEIAMLHEKSRVALIPVGRLTDTRISGVLLVLATGL